MNENGYQDAQTAFERAKHNMLQKANSRSINSRQSYKELELYLKRILFPSKDNKADQELANKFMSLLQQTYEKTTDKILTSNLTDISYKTIIRPTFKDSTTTKGRHLQTIKRQRDEVVKMLDSIYNSGKLREIEQIINVKLDKTIKQILLEVDNLIKDYTESKLESGALTGKNLLTDKYTKENIVQISKNLDAIYNTLSQSGAITMKDYGDVLEYALALINLDIENTTEEVTDEMLTILEQTKTGQITVDRGGIQFDALIPGAKKGDSFTIGNLKFNYNPSISTGGKRQGKGDVTLILPDSFKSKGTQFKISAKNWIEIDSLHDLGRTDLLSALARSTEEQNVVDLYAFTLQTPERQHSDLLALSHKIAEISILLDIVMGASQSKGYADTLIILDRRNTEVYVRNIPEMINSVIYKITNTLIIHGYDASSLEQYAIIAREIALKRPKDESQSKIYLSYMYNILKSVEVSVQFIIANKKQ